MNKQILILALLVGFILGFVITAAQEARADIHYKLHSGPEYIIGRVVECPEWQRGECIAIHGKVYAFPFSTGHKVGDIVKLLVTYHLEE